MDDFTSYKYDRPDLPEMIELKREEFLNESIRSKIKQTNKQQRKKVASFYRSLEQNEIVLLLTLGVISQFRRREKPQTRARDLQRERARDKVYYYTDRNFPIGCVRRRSRKRRSREVGALVIEETGRRGTLDGRKSERRPFDPDQRGTHES